MSADGRTIVYGAAHAGPGGTWQVYSTDMDTGKTTMVSKSLAGKAGNLSSIGGVRVSDDGRFVVFESSASNLVAAKPIEDDPDTEWSGDLYIRDMRTGAIERIANNLDGYGYGIDISADGRQIYVQSGYDDLLIGSQVVSHGVYKVENPFLGNVDTVRASISYTLGLNVENLVLTGSTKINGTGNTLNNGITGNSSDNVLTGAAGNDVLKGSAGNDKLIGGAGKDTFVFSTALNAGSNVDTITDFKAADDTIQLDNAAFRKLAATGVLNTANFKASATGNAADANDYILYETDTGKLFYDADGNGAGAKVLFAILGTSFHPAITAADFVVT